MNEISKVMYRANNSTSDWDGGNQQCWFGEDSYEVGESAFGGTITYIGMAFAFNSPSMPVVQIIVEGKGKVCEIPWHMVCRLYYK